MGIPLCIGMSETKWWGEQEFIRGHSLYNSHTLNHLRNNKLQVRCDIWYQYICRLEIWYTGKSFSTICVFTSHFILWITLCRRDSLIYCKTECIKQYSTFNKEKQYYTFSTYICKREWAPGFKLSRNWHG